MSILIAKLKELHFASLTFLKTVRYSFVSTTFVHDYSRKQTARVKLTGLQPAGVELITKKVKLTASEVECFYANFPTGRMVQKVKSFLFVKITMTR